MNVARYVGRLKVRQMIAIPLAIAIFFSVAIAVRGVPASLEFSSGTMISYRGFDNRPNASEIKQALATMFDASVKVEVTQDPTTLKYGLDIHTTKVLDENLKEDMQRTLEQQFGISGTPDVIPFEPAISETYQRQAIFAITGALAVIGIILLVVFRKKILLFTLACICLNMLAAFGGMALLQVEFSLASLAGILLLIGYSIDTNILLAMHVLKQKGGEVRERVANAKKTGFMITGTTIATMMAVNVIVTNPSIDQLSVVLVFGLISDLFNTWFLNTGILIWYADHKIRKDYYVSL